MMLASILDAFLVFLRPSEGNKSKNAKTSKTMVLHSKTIVFQGPAVAKVDGNGTFLWSFCGSVFGMPF